MKNTNKKAFSIHSGGVHLPAKLCQLTADAFNGIFEDLIENETYEDAYEILERSHVRIFKLRRYSSYDSFRKARAKRINRVPKN